MTQQFLVQRKQKARVELYIDWENGIVDHEAVRFSEASNARKHRHCDCKMCTCTVSSQHDLFKIHSQLGSGLSNDPDVCLVSVVHRVGVRICRSQSVVNGEDRNEQLCRPLPRVALVARWVLTYEAAPVKVNDRSFNRHCWLWHFTRIEVNMLQFVRA